MEETFAWLVTAVGLFLLEILTPGVFFFACLGVGALAAAAASFLGAGPLWLWIIFCSVSVASVYFIRPVARRYFGNIKKKSNVDALIGRDAPLLERTTPDVAGLVKIDGELWKVSSPETIESGERVEVVAVEGTHLIVRKTPKQ